VATTYERVRRVIAEQLGYDERHIKDTARLTSDLDADSLDRVELLMALEDEFEITVSDADAEEFSNATVSEIAKAIKVRRYEQIFGIK
jgi:acyl carrier protein